jgi:hypothetical protein
MSARSYAARAVAAIGLIVALALPATALAGPKVTVRVEGETKALLAPTQVEVGNGTGIAKTWNGVGSMPHECDDDTAYQAIEKATKGNWDRGIFLAEVMGETHTWSPNEEMWIFYYNRNYADRGICDQHLKEGDTILIQAGVSGPPPNFIPESVPLELQLVEPTSGIVEQGGELTVHVTAWQPTDIFGTEDPEEPGHFIIPPSEEVDGVGYTVKAGKASDVTDGNGEAILTLNDPGPVKVAASTPGSEDNWSRTVPVEVCVDDGEPGTC